MCESSSIAAARLFQDLTRPILTEIQARDCGLAQGESTLFHRSFPPVLTRDSAQWWPRPLGICQWTLSGAPHHPIFIDVTRRVINATRYVDEQVSGPLVEELREVELRIKEVAITEDGSRQEVQALEEEAKRLRHMVETEQGVLPV